MYDFSKRVPFLFHFIIYNNPNGKRKHAEVKTIYFNPLKMAVTNKIAENTFN